MFRGTIKNLYIIIFLIFSLLLAELNAEASRFLVGEKLTYSIYVGGIKIGFQTIEIRSIETLKGVEVYKIKGRSKTTPFISMFYRLDDKWSIYIDTNNLRPVRVEKNMVEGKKTDFIIYDIDQDNRKINIRNVESDITMVVKADNDVFDIISMSFFFRENAPLYKNKGDIIVFDFLKSKSVQTVHFKNMGEYNIRIPALAGRTLFNTNKYKKVGKTEIEFFVSNDKMNLPLKMTVNTRLTKNIRVNIEVYLVEYSSEAWDNPFPAEEKKKK